MKPAALILPAALLLALPVAAQQSGTDWVAAAKAYDAGKNSGTSPQTTGEYTTCAAYWTNWAKALKAKRIPAVDLKPLPAAVKLPAAQQTANGWLALLKQKNIPDRNLASEQATVSARIDAAIGGDGAAANATLEWLGLCPLPKV
ncbi:hypothetical protein P1X14_21005 [Sphingomonas sp. AOB5]|uniref:hypothetical protein n=1 Tax=Sphingomonas sp. AOB5 TaxID=3034017 RepID=UPI0023F91069|nr:hypothetical protein [Sphingomonas sp. AOB5]MDF7777748.1 hypothetical protein [Sphingomonas sp. AOB5]